MTQKRRFANHSPYIHSKPVQYINNGGGRDTYISNSAGGLSVPYRPAYQKRTFYNNLRQYDQTNYGFGKRGASHTATHVEKGDVFSNTQNHFNHKYKRELSMVKTYQQMMDVRLSKPKKIQEGGEGKKTYKNSDAGMQEEMQRSFYRSNANISPPLSPRVMRSSAAFEENHVSYTNLKKIRNTIDM